MRRLLVPMIAALAGCQGDAPSEPVRDPVATTEPTAGAAPAPVVTPSAQAAAPGLALDVEGLRLVLETGSTRLLAFGAPRAQAEAAVMSAGRHQPERTAIEECGAGPIEITAFGPLQLNFQDGTFVGWFLEAKGPSTIDGIAVGSTRAEVESSRTLTMVPDSTLGEEFVLGDLASPNIGGFFDGPGEQARVTHLYAGTNCFFR